MIRPREHFPDTLYSPWCRAWIRVVGSHGQRLANWLDGNPQSTVAAAIRVDWDTLVSTLPRLVVDLEAGAAEDLSLVRTYGCLLELEARHRGESRRWFAPPPEIEAAGRRYALVPPTRKTARPPDAPATTFKLSSQVGIAGAHGLEYCWVPLEDDDILDWHREAALDAVLANPRLRLGLAPCATHEQMTWHLDDQAPRGRDGRMPLRCGGAKDAATLWPVIESLLTAAYREEVQVLLLPELILDEAMLAQCRDWLERQNLPSPRLRLIVAGTRHCGEGNDFANRCTVLDQGGALLWEQDKRSPFVIDDRGALARLSPGCRAQAAFEPTILGRQLAVRESAAGRLLTPICLDFIEGALWSELGADIFLVPAMSPGLERFRDRARDMGTRHGAASFVCNAQCAGQERERYVAYLPIRRSLPPTALPGHELFILDVQLYV